MFEDTSGTMINAKLRAEAELIEAYDDIAREQGVSRNTAMLEVLRNAVANKAGNKKEKRAAKPTQHNETPEELRRLLKWWAGLPGGEAAWSLVRDVTKHFPTLPKYTEWASTLSRFNRSEGEISGNQKLLQCMAMVEKMLENTDITEASVLKAAKKARAKF